MRKIRMNSLLAGLSLSFFLSGCAFIESEKTQVDAERPQDIESQAMVEFDAAGQKYGETMLEAWRDGDFEKMKSVPSVQIFADLKEEAFASERDKFMDAAGTPSEWHYLTDLQIPPFKGYLWKVRLQKAQEGGVVLERDVICQTMMGNFDGEYKVMSFYFR